MTTLIGAVSDFSLGDSLLSPEDVAKYAKEFGYDAVALTDNVLSSMIRFVKACKKYEIKPILGAKLRLVDDPTDKTPIRKRETPNRECFVKVFVKNETGMRELSKLISLANDEEHFYYYPRLGFMELVDALHSQGLCLSSGSDLGLFSHPEGRQYWKAIKRAIDPADAFLELNAIRTPYYERINEETMKVYQEGDSLIVSRPALYLHGEQDTLDVLKAITTNTEMDKPNRSISYTRDFNLYRPKELTDKIREIGQSMKTRLIIPEGIWMKAWHGNDLLRDKCQYQWEKQPVSLPHICPDEVGLLNQKVSEGWKTRLKQSVFGHQPTDLISYKDRLVYELGVIKQMGFVRYFLMVADLINWAKGNDIPVGCGRGSVGGSLIAFLLGITDVDPIRFDLMFERFINPERIDLPDIDIDFATSKREKVIAYLVETYGEDRVAAIMNFSTLASASALRDTCRIHGMEIQDYACTKLVPKEHGVSFDLEQAADAIPEIEKFRQKFPSIWAHSVALQGKMRSYGTHAAGVCVAGEPILNRAPVSSRVEGLPVIMLDKREIEDQGLIKLDCLGLSTLDILNMACEMIETNHGVKIDLLAIDLNDPNVLNAFAQGDTNAVFQMESRSAKTLLTRIGSKGGLTFNDLVAVNALNRPGPLESGLAEQYVNCRVGAMTVYFDHPSLEPVLGDTFGAMIFQEQISKSCQVLAGFTGSEADNIRKAIGKKSIDEMMKWKDKFINGCVTTSNLDRGRAEKLFEKIEKFASYSFNKSHSVEYTLISYQCQYLKVYYPAEFYAASMSILDSERLPDLINDAITKGIEVSYPDINLSGVHYTTHQSRLIAPFTAIKGLSEKTAIAIVAAREQAGGRFHTVFDFLNNADLRKCNKRIQEALDRVGAFSSLDFSDQGLTGKLEKSYPWISTDQSPLMDKRRQHDQLNLLPGLAKVTSISKVACNDKQTRQVIAELTEQVFSCQACSFCTQPHVGPRYGKRATVMIVSDCPTWGETEKVKMVEGLGSEYLEQALEKAGFEKSDFYWTTLVKSKKEKGSLLKNEQINACSRFLEQEIEAVQPGLIVTLGGAATKYFMGKKKVKTGDVEYLPARNLSVLAGLSPAGIYMNPGNQHTLNNLFIQVKSIISV